MKNIIDKYKDYNLFTEVDLDSNTSPNKGLLTGHHIVVKDNVNVKGFKTTAGTPALSDYKPNKDATIVAKLRASGARVIAKTNLHELAFGITNNNYHFGPVRNPVDPSLFAGGSSGGTAAAIALGIADIGLGTDTGGSCNIPAALCGVIGYRPTMNRYPTDGIVPLSHTRDTPGLLSNDLNLIQLYDEVITEDRERSVMPKKVRIGVPRHYFFDNLSKEVSNATEAVLRQLTNKQSIELVEVDMLGIEKLLSLSIALVLHETNVDLREFLKAYETGVSFKELSQQVVSPDVKELFDSGAINPIENYNAALLEREDLLQLYQEYFTTNKLDAIIYPTTVVEARPIIGSDAEVTIDGNKFPTFPTYIQNTNPGSYAGLPSISLPLAKTSQGLPVGIHLETMANKDKELFAIAELIQNELQ